MAAVHGRAARACTVHPVREAGADPAGRTRAPYRARSATSCTPSPIRRARPDEAAGARFLVSADCPVCGGKRLRPEALAVTFAGRDIAEMSALPLKRLAEMLRPYADGEGERPRGRQPAPGEGGRSRSAIAADSRARLPVLLDLGLGYLTLGPEHPDPLAGRAATAAAGDAVALGAFRRRLRPRRALGRSASGRHGGAADGAGPAQGGGQLAVRRRARHGGGAAGRLGRGRGPAGGRARGRGALQRPSGGLAQVAASATRRYLFGRATGAGARGRRARRARHGAWLVLEGVDRQQPSGTGRRVSARGASRRSPEFPGPGSRPWSARSWPVSSPTTPAGAAGPGGGRAVPLARRRRG